MGWVVMAYIEGMMLAGDGTMMTHSDGTVMV